MYASLILVLLSIAAPILAFPNASCESTERVTDVVTRQIPSLQKLSHTCEFGFAASYLLEKLKKAEVKKRLPPLIRVLDWKGKTVLLTTYKKCKNAWYCVKTLLRKGKKGNRIIKSIKRQSKGANSIGCDLWRRKQRTALFCVFSPKILEYDDHYIDYNQVNPFPDSYEDYAVEDPNATFTNLSY
ncbi:unnamed protein product [Cylicocyclus nassatus]|uniref:Uncharacterized protein n=1 Tax=Cylicocyclus nassatus TaxID=53992 RepID=A0AA36DK03_CYLNA|nr:unnamed protein product [Cylicocyclus nassatus]